MAKNVIINGNTYQNVPEVDIPLVDGGVAQFFDTSDATGVATDLLLGVSMYGASGKISGSIVTKTSSDVTVSGATVTVPDGYYEESVSKSVAAGSATTPATSITANPTITIDATGLITATASASQSVTPVVTAGYVSTGTAGTVSVSGSATQQMTTLGATTYTPTTSNQTISSGTYLIGVQTISGDANLLSQNILSGVSIFGVSGSLSVPVISQDSTTKVLSIS